MFSKFCERDLHPEFIQEEVNAENLIQAYKAYDRSSFLSDSKSLRSYLEHGSSKTVASLIENRTLS